MISQTAQNKRQNNVQRSLSHIKISQNWSTFLPPLSSFISFTSFYLVFFSYHPSRPCLTYSLKIANRSFNRSAYVLWNSLRLIYVAHHVTSSPILNTPDSDLSHLFLNKLKTYFFYCFSFIVCIHLGYLNTDISGIDQASLFHLVLIDNIYLHFIHPNFVFI